MPVHHVRSCVVAVADAELFERLTLLLRPRAPLLDEEQLPLVVAVPRGPRPRFEAATANAEILGFKSVRPAGETRVLLLRVTVPARQDDEYRTNEEASAVRFISAVISAANNLSRP